MLSLCFNHVATVASPFRSSVFHFLATRSKICEIFFSCEKKTMKLSLLHNNVNTSSHIKGNVMALPPSCQFELWLKVWDVPSTLSLPRQGPWNLVWVKQVFELSEVELTEFHCIHINGHHTMTQCHAVTLWHDVSNFTFIVGAEELKKSIGSAVESDMPQDCSCRQEDADSFGVKVTTGWDGRIRRRRGSYWGRVRGL